MAKSHLALTIPVTVIGTVLPHQPPRRRANAETRAREYLTDAEVQKLMRAAGNNRNGHRDATMVLLAYRHGLRPIELVTLRWDAVDFARGQIHVGRAKNGSPSVHPLAASSCGHCAGLSASKTRPRLSYSRPSGAPFYDRRLAQDGGAFGRGGQTRFCDASAHAAACLRVFSLRTKALTHAPCRRTWAIATSSTLCAIPNCRRRASRTSGATDGTGRPGWPL